MPEPRIWLPDYNKPKWKQLHKLLNSTRVLEGHFAIASDWAWVSRGDAQGQMLPHSLVRAVGVIALGRPNPGTIETASVAGHGGGRASGGNTRNKTWFQCGVQSTGRPDKRGILMLTDVINTCNRTICPNRNKKYQNTMCDCLGQIFVGTATPPWIPQTNLIIFWNNNTRKKRRTPLPVDSIWGFSRWENIYPPKK